MNSSTRLNRIGALAVVANLVVLSSAAEPVARNAMVSRAGDPQMTGDVGTSPRKIELRPDTLDPIDVDLQLESLNGKPSLRVTKKPEAKGVDQPTFARLKGVDFKDGTIELSVRSHDDTPAPRGFIGVAFRINSNNSTYESIYLRPGNSRIDDQVRRNRTVQYYAYPDFPFSRLREEAAGKYESYADVGLDEWIRLRIVVSGIQARLFVNERPQPVLVVTDLKHGADASGGVGLWVDLATVGHFADVIVSPK